LTSSQARNLPIAPGEDDIEVRAIEDDDEDDEDIEWDDDEDGFTGEECQKTIDSCYSAASCEAWVSKMREAATTTLGLGWS
jgi:hypothetical protein